MTLLLALLLAAEPATSHQVSIPLDDYEALRKQGERPALTVIDLLRVEGSFARRDLSVVLAGRASGSWPTVGVLSAEGARLHSCEGDALLAREESGGFTVTPLAPRFTLRCKVALDGSDRLAARTTAAVLEVAAAVADGELVAAAAGAGREFSVVRRIAGAEQQDLPPTVTGRYLVTLLPDEARFTYQLEVRNPARGHRRFEVGLREAEHVENVDARVAWDAEGTRYRFDLPPGETVLVLRGRLSEPRFVPPVDASLQYLLVESHPLIRPELRTEARRVGVSETGLAARFRGAQAFLLGGGVEVGWTATRLEALKTAGVALGDLQQVWFLDAQGTARGEVTLAIDNQGSPALTLPGTTRPTFASIGGEPVFLTHDRDGNLFLPLAQGPQQVVVQDAHPFSHRLGFGLARLELPRLQVPASRAGVELRFPREWVPVYEELAPQARLHLLDLYEAATLLLVVALAERLLALGAVPGRRRWPLALALGLAGAFVPALRVGAFWLLALAWVALGVAHQLRGLRSSVRWVVLAAAGLCGLLVLLKVATGVVGRQGSDALEYRGYSNVMMSKEKLGRAAAAPAPVPPAAQDAAAGAQSYEGLPARIEIPPGARQAQFTRELLATDTPRTVVVVMIAARALSALATGAVLLLLGLALLFRRSLVSAAAALAARARAGGAPAPAGA